MVKFTQELKDKWIEHYSNSQYCFGDFKKGNCLCAYGALYDVLVQENKAVWDDRHTGFGDLSRTVPYFEGPGIFDFDTIAGQIYRKHDDLVSGDQNPVPVVVDLIKQLPVEE